MGQTAWTARQAQSSPTILVDQAVQFEAADWTGPPIRNTGKVVMSRAIGVVRSLESKLFKEYILMDAVCTLDSTLVFYYTTKLPELGFPSVYILYTWCLRKEVA